MRLDYIFLYIVCNICNHISHADINNGLQASKSTTKCRNGSLIYTRSVADVHIQMKQLTSPSNSILDEDPRPCFFCSCGPEGVPDRCIAVKSYLCMYFARIHEVTYSDQLAKTFSSEYNQLWKEMEDTIVDYVTQSGDDLSKLSCIPLLSSYTDCNIDNVCSGCKRCTCNVHGHWACDLVQFCSKCDEPTDELERAMISTLQHIDPEHQPATPKPQGPLIPDLRSGLDSPKNWVSAIVHKLEKPFEPNAAPRTERPAYENRIKMEHSDSIVQNLTEIIKSKESELQVYKSLKKDFLRDLKFSDESAEKSMKPKIYQMTQSSEEYIKITDAPDTSQLFKKISKLKSDIRNVIFDIEAIKNEAKTKNIGYIINSDIDNLVVAMKKYTFRRQQRRNTRRSESITSYKNISKKNPYEMVKYAEVFDTVIKDMDSLRTDPRTRRLYVKNRDDLDLSKMIDKLDSAIDKNERIYKFYDETDFKMIFLKLQQLEVIHFTNLLNEFSANMENYRGNSTRTELIEHVNKKFELIEDIFKVKEVNLKIVSDSSSRPDSLAAESSSKFKKYLLEQIIKLKNFKNNIVTRRNLLDVLITNRMNNGSIKKRNKRNIRDVFDNLVASISKFTPRVLQERMRVRNGKERKQENTAEHLNI